MEFRPELHGDSDSVVNSERAVQAGESSTTTHTSVDLTIARPLSRTLPLESSDPFHGVTELPPDVMAMLRMWELEKDRFARFGGVYSALSIEDEWDMLRARNTWDDEPSDLFENPSTMLVAEMRYRPFMLSRMVYLARYGLWHRRIRFVQTTIWARQCLVLMNPTIPRMCGWIASLARACTIVNYFHRHSQTSDDERPSSSEIWMTARLTTHQTAVGTRPVPTAQRRHPWIMLNTRGTVTAPREATHETLRRWPT